MIWRRLAKDYLRNPYRLRVRFIVMTFIAVLVDLTYHNLGKGNSSI